MTAKGKNYAILAIANKFREKFSVEYGDTPLMAAKSAFRKEWAKRGENDDFPLTVCAAPSGLPVGEYGAMAKCGRVDGDSRLHGYCLNPGECVAREWARMRSDALLDDDPDAWAWVMALQMEMMLFAVLALAGNANMEMRGCELISARDTQGG